MVESFNLLNRLNRRFHFTDDGARSNTAQFNYGTKHIGINYFPAYYQVPTNLAKATSAYAPRQVQLSLANWILILSWKPTASSGKFHIVLDFTRPSCNN